MRLISPVFSCLLLAAGLWLGLSGLHASRADDGHATDALRFEKIAGRSGTLYVVTVPHDPTYRVEALVVDGIQPLTRFSKMNPGAVALINGGFFDPANAQTTSFLTQAGQPAGDPRNNARLTKNPALQPYLAQIFDRTEFRTYACRGRTRYDIVRHGAPIAGDCQIQSVLGAGPELLPKLASAPEGFVDYDAKGRVTRDPIGVGALNARSAVGVMANGDVLIIMGAQKPDDPRSGFTLAQMADAMRDHGAVKAMALDGGSSSGLIFEGNVFYGKFNAKAQPVIRPVKSVLAVIRAR